MKRKVVINTCFGGFGLSPLAEKLYYEKKNPGKTIYFYKQSYDSDFSTANYKRINEKNPRGPFIILLSEDFGPEFTITEKDRDQKTEFYERFDKAYVYLDDYVRHDPDLIEIVECLGSDANGNCVDLKIIDIGDKLYRIEEYDGNESLITPGDDIWL